MTSDSLSLVCPCSFTLSDVMKGSWALITIVRPVRLAHMLPIGAVPGFASVDALRVQRARAAVVAHAVRVSNRA